MFAISRRQVVEGEWFGHSDFPLLQGRRRRSIIVHRKSPIADDFRYGSDLITSKRPIVFIQFGIASAFGASQDCSQIKGIKLGIDSLSGLLCFADGFHFLDRETVFDPSRGNGFAMRIYLYIGLNAE